MEEVKRALKIRGRQHPAGASAGTAAKGAQQPEAQKAPRPGACQISFRSGVENLNPKAQPFLDAVIWWELLTVSHKFPPPAGI